MDSVTLSVIPSSFYFIRLSTQNPKSSFLLCPHKDNKFKVFKSSQPTHFPNSFSTLNSKSRNPSSSISCSATTTETPSTTSEDSALCKLKRLVSEFESLSEPIDRVKLLLHYATLIPPFDDSERVNCNRVNGCTTEVWLVVKMDEFGRMKFRADSDSEISKGFSSCLIWILDGAFPHEVLKLKTEDLVGINVGLIGKAHSRVNTWQNVLISMQMRTKSLVQERERNSNFNHLSSSIISSNDCK